MTNLQLHPATSRNARFHRALLALTVLTAGLCVSPIGAEEKLFDGAVGTRRINLDEAVPASSFPTPPFVTVVAPAATADDKSYNIKCTHQVYAGGVAVNGDEVTFRGNVFSSQTGELFKVLTPQTKGYSNRNARVSYGNPIPSDPNSNFVVVQVFADLLGDTMIDGAQISCRTTAKVRCDSDDPKELCLTANNRFMAKMKWSDGVSGGSASSAQITGSEGYFYFFDEGSPVLSVQIRNRCSGNDHYWVVADAVTDVEYTLKVTDTETGTTRVYENELGQMAESVIDTAAFATCP